MALLLGAYADGVTNLIGNAVATIAVAVWDDALDLAKAQDACRNRTAVAADQVIPETEAGRAPPRPTAVAP